MRRLPVYLLLDCSGSMSGEPIEAVKSGMQMLLSGLRQDPQALESAYLSVITFDSSAKQLVPLTDLASFQMPDIAASGTTALGEALSLLCQCAKNEIVKSTPEIKGDWRPLVFIMTDGEPTDNFNKGLAEFQSMKWGITVSCAAGQGANVSTLKAISPESVVMLDTADKQSLAAFFKWVSSSISTSSKSVNDTKQEINGIDQLPPLHQRLTWFRFSADDYKDFDMRRLPVYLLLDTSGSMKGEPIEAVRCGIHTLISTLRRDPQALETVFICIITFDREVKVIVPLTSLESLQIPEIEIPDSGPTMLGAALEVLCQQVDKEVILSSDSVKKDWKPLLFIMTDGKPSDTKMFNEMIPECKKRNFAIVTGCAAGMKADTKSLQLIASSVVKLDTCDSATFEQYFKWVSASIMSGSQSVGTSIELTLPPPPSEVEVII